tara:strand:+ start:505 stop:666 length:162 start_codon:yes stop_codon:yes gene_type:complete
MEIYIIGGESTKIYGHNLLDVVILENLRNLKHQITEEGMEIVDYLISLNHYNY